MMSSVQPPCQPRPGGLPHEARAPGAADRAHQPRHDGGDPHPADDRDGRVGEGREFARIAVLDCDHGRAIDSRAHGDERRRRLRHEHAAGKQARRERKGEHLEIGRDRQDREKIGRRKTIAGRGGIDDGRSDRAGLHLVRPGLGANDAGYNVRSKLIQKNGKYRVAVEVRRRIGKFRRVE